MTVKEIFKKAVIAGADPLSITELGFAYLNDRHLEYQYQFTEHRLQE